MINDVVNNGFQPVSNAPAADPVVAAPVESTVAQPTPSSEKPVVVDAGRLDKAVSKLNDFVQNSQRKLSFSVSAETGRAIIKVYDAETDELIRQIPPEETIKFAENIDVTTAGLFVKERA